MAWPPLSVWLPQFPQGSILEPLLYLIIILLYLFLSRFLLLSICWWYSFFLPFSISLWSLNAVLISCLSPDILLLIFPKPSTWSFHINALLFYLFFLYYSSSRMCFAFRVILNPQLCQLSWTPHIDHICSKFKKKHLWLIFCKLYWLPLLTPCSSETLLVFSSSSSHLLFFSLF